MASEPQPTSGSARSPRRESILNLLVCLLAGGVAFTFYRLTLLPGVPWGDGGELTTAAYFWGIPHTPGYPLWTAIAHMFTKLPWGTVAFRVNLMSAVCGACGVAMVCAAALHLTANRLAALAGALTFAFATTFWGQCVEAEVYAPAIFFLALLIVLAFRWEQQPSVWLAGVFGFLYGLGLGAHLMLAMLAPAFLYWFVLAPRGRRANLRQVAVACGLFLVGASVYALLPIRALANPGFDVGRPTTLANFIYHVTGRAARSYMFAVPTEDLPARLQYAFSLLGAQFVSTRTPPAEWGWAMSAWLAVATALTRLFFLGLAGWGMVSLLKNRYPAAMFLSLIYLIVLGVGINYDIVDVDVYFTPSYLPVALLIAVGAKEAISAVRRLPGLTGQSSRRASALIAAVLILAPLGVAIDKYPALDESPDHDADDFARASLAIMPKRALLITDWWFVGPLWYRLKVEGDRAGDDLRITADFSRQPEYRSLESLRSPEFADRRVFAAEHFTEGIPRVAALYPLLPKGPWVEVIRSGELPREKLPLTRLPVAQFWGSVRLWEVEVSPEEVSEGGFLKISLLWEREVRDTSAHSVLLYLESGGARSERIWRERSSVFAPPYPPAPDRGMGVREEVYVFLAGEYPERIPPGEYTLWAQPRVDDGTPHAQLGQPVRLTHVRILPRQQEH